MSAPVRIVYGERNTYRLDPYVRDTAGRFAPHPPATPPPVQLLEDSGRVQVLHGGALIVGPGDPRCRWTVRVIRDADGSHRVTYLQDQ